MSGLPLARNVRVKSIACFTLPLAESERSVMNLTRASMRIFLRMSRSSHSVYWRRYSARSCSASIYSSRLEISTMRSVRVLSGSCVSNLAFSRRIMQREYSSAESRSRLRGASSSSLLRLSFVISPPPYSARNLDRPPNSGKRPMMESCAMRSAGRLTTGVPERSMRYSLPSAMPRAKMVCCADGSLTRWLSSMIIDLNNLMSGVKTTSFKRKPPCEPPLMSHTKYLRRDS